MKTRNQKIQAILKEAFEGSGLDIRTLSLRLNWSQAFLKRMISGDVPDYLLDDVSDFLAACGYKMDWVIEGEKSDQSN